MKPPRLCLGITTVAVVIGLSISPAIAHADAYQIYSLPVGNVVGITDSGVAVLLVDPTDCNGTPGHCYETFVDGDLTGKSLTAPDLTYDNGTLGPPQAPVAGIAPAATVSNDGHEVTWVDIAADSPYAGDIFTGPDPVADLFAHGDLDNIALNSSGDFVYVADVRTGESTGVAYQVIDLTTAGVPEPRSIFLLGAGLFAAETMRRRWFQRKCERPFSHPSEREPA